MRKFIALLVITSILMVAILPAALAQQTVKPGENVTVEVAFSGEEIRFVDLVYELSSGLEFVKGELKGGGLGKAGSKRAIYLKNNLAGFTSGSLILTIKAKADAKGEQSVNVKTIQGYKLGSGMVDMKGAGAKKITIDAGGGGAAMPGDANGDKAVTHEDLTAIILYILDDKPLASKENADANGDNAITHEDLTAIILYILDDKPMR